MSDIETEYKPYELMFRCPHCGKTSKVKIMVRTDDESTKSAFELLSNFEIKGKKEEE